MVDEKDQIIGYKKRKDIKPTDCFRITGVWIEDSQGQVLIAQRSLKKNLHPGLWGPTAAGGVEKGESYTENAYKELQEEVGLSDIKLDLIIKEHIFYPNNSGQRYVAWFKGIWDGSVDELVLEDAVEGVKWIGKDELRRDLQDHPQNYVPSAIHYWKPYSSGSY